MDKKVLAVFLLIGTFFSCSNKEKSIKREVLNRINISTEEIKFSPSEILNAEAYNVSSSCLIDSDIWVVGYNRHLHSLDFIKPDTKEIFQTGLEEEGDASIIRPISIHAHNLDSIWIYDQTGQLTLMDHKGHIRQKENLNKQTNNSNEKVMINTNHAMYTSKLYYNKKRGSLFYIVKRDDLFYAKECFLNDKDSIKYYPLALPYTTDKKISSNFGNMDGVNATFTDDWIIYNYPIESVFYVFNILTGENKLVESYSAYTQNTVKPFTAVNDYFKWERHGLENPHFYEIMYVPKYKMYMQLHLKETEFNQSKSILELSDSRELYLICWDESFQFLCEIMLPNHRYNYYTGWCGIYDGLLLYVNNSTSQEMVDGLLTIDIIRPQLKVKK